MGLTVMDKIIINNTMFMHQNVVNLVNFNLIIVKFVP